MVETVFAEAKREARQCALRRWRETNPWDLASAQQREHTTSPARRVNVATWHACTFDTDLTRRPVLQLLCFTFGKSLTGGPPPLVPHFVKHVYSKNHD